MIEPPQLFTHERLVFDIREIESLATLIMDLAIPIDRALCESFERLVELAGTRDFIIAFSRLQEYMFQIKSKQNFIVDTGSIVPQSYLSELAEWTKNHHNQVEELDLSKIRSGGLIGRENKSFQSTEENFSLFGQTSIIPISNSKTSNDGIKNFTDEILSVSDSDSDIYSDFSSASHTRSSRKYN